MGAILTSPHPCTISSCSRAKIYQEVVQRGVSDMVQPSYYAMCREYEKSLTSTTRVPVLTDDTRLLRRSFTSPQISAARCLSFLSFSI